MAEYGETRSGKPLTDEIIAELAERAEAGFDVEAIVERRRGGRPSLGSGPATVESVRLDPDLREALLQRAEAEHSTPSAVIREALRRYLDVA